MDRLATFALTTLPQSLRYVRRVVCCRQPDVSAQLYQRFNQEAEQSAVQAQEDEKRRQREAEEAYERKLRENMFAAAQRDKELRAQEAEQRRQEAERRRMELEEARMIEAEQRAQANEALR